MPGKGKLTAFCLSDGVLDNLEAVSSSMEAAIITGEHWRIFLRKKDCCVFERYGLDTGHSGGVQNVGCLLVEKERMCLLVGAVQYFL